MKKHEQYILATCTVPWDENYSFAENVFRKQIRHILKHGTRHIYIFGTAGEGYAVTESQFRQITETFYEEMKAADSDPMVGIISMSLPTVIERIEWSYKLGVRSFQLSLPAWGPCTFDEIRSFFSHTCGRFADCSFLHYNCPRCKRLITPDEYGLLADEFSNLRATKNGAGGILDIISLTQKAPEMRHFLTEFNFAQAHLLGLDAGLLISVASINWKSAKLFYNSCVDKNVGKINKYILELKDIHKKLLDIVGTQGHIDGAYDKMFSKIADNDFPLRLLPPYTYADDSAFVKFQQYIKNSYPNWIAD
jgi:dihydrodipicolinate synthase/N-acetylneuraminate lyase